MTPETLTNLALLKLGVTKTVTVLATDNTVESTTALLVFDHVLRRVLRRFPWAFATKYAALTLTQGTAWSTSAPVQAWASGQIYNVGHVVSSGGTFYYCISAHTAASPTNNPPNPTFWLTTAPTTAALSHAALADWLYAYRYPSDCIFARRLVPPSGDGMGRQWNRHPPRSRVSRDSNGKLIYTHEQDAVLEYTTIDCTNLWADDLFIDAFTWDLAAAMAPGLSKLPELIKHCLAMREVTIGLADAVDAREQEQDKPGEAQWIEDR